MQGNKMRAGLVDRGFGERSVDDGWRCLRVQTLRNAAFNGLRGRENAKMLKNEAETDVKKRWKEAEGRMLQKKKRVAWCFVVCRTYTPAPSLFGWAEF